MYKFALNYSLSFIDDSGLMNVTSPADWLRFGMSGRNIEANAILYYVLNQGLYLSTVMNETSTTSWENHAKKIKQAAYNRLWDSDANLYRDNDTRPLTTLHPQDGNAWAVVSGFTTSAEQASNISKALAAIWS
jgi:neutral trehalase